MKQRALILIEFPNGQNANVGMLQEYLVKLGWKCEIKAVELEFVKGNFPIIESLKFREENDK